MSSGIYNKHSGYHNRRSIRLQGYDYSQPGYYFVTVCVHDRKQLLFGDVVENHMVLNECGKHVEHCWNEIAVHFPYANIDEYVIMPNHVHGIIQLREMDNENVMVQSGGVNNPVGVQNFEPLRHFELLRNDSKQNEFQHIVPRSIGSIIRGFKIGVTKLFRAQKPGFIVWQRNYYEHIIREETSLYFIRKYIRENPIRWDDASENHIDKEFMDFDLMVTRGIK
jgi:REP element-mobilizing transposase RayT